jgi:predicted nucleotidyltransferase
VGTDLQAPFCERSHAGHDVDVTARIPIDRRRIRDFCERHHIRRLALFGFVLRDDFRPDSDVDVLVELEPGHVPGFGFFSIQRELSSLLGKAVDLNTPGFLSKYFRDDVVRSAEVQYERAR